MQYPDSVIEAAREATLANIEDIGAAAAEAERRIRSLPEFAGLVDTMVSDAVRELVHDQRHNHNKRLRLQSDLTGPRVVVGHSQAVSAAYEDEYGYAIGRTALGAIRGKELAGLVQREEDLARGHTFNAQLCRRLAEYVQGEDTVRDALKPNQLRKLFAEAKKAARAA